jgi:hypothetical protein
MDLGRGAQKDILHWNDIGESHVGLRLKFVGPERITIMGGTTNDL